MKSTIIASAGLVAVASAFTRPTVQTYGALTSPSGSSPIITGQTNTITWEPKQPADGVTVSFVLCNGPGANCVLQGAAIAEQVPASAGSYSWNVPCSLPEGTASTESGYGMLIIVDGTGEFQYSTQFSVTKGASCSSSSSSTSSSTSSVSTSSVVSSSTTEGRPTTGTDSAKTWMNWQSSTTLSTSSAVPVVTTSKPAVTTSAYFEPTSSATYASHVTGAPSSTTAQPAVYTGAASSNMVGFAGMMAAGLAVFAL